MTAMIGFLGTLFWALLALAQFLTGLLMRALLTILWLFWPVVLVVGFLVASAQSAEAGWFSWLWGSDTRQLERSLDVAQEAARVASQAAESQAQQAEAQAQQNARLAETLGQLSSERSNLADHISALTELGLKDSQWAAAVTATGPLLVCITVLLVAGLALWLVNRTGESQQHSDLAETVDLLVGEIATYRPAEYPGASGPAGLGGLRAGKLTHALRGLPVLAGHGVDERAPGYDGERASDSEFPEDMPPEDTGPDDDSGPMPF